jgi:hypothetical protein
MIGESELRCFTHRADGDVSRRLFNKGATRCAGPERQRWRYTQCDCVCSCSNAVVRYRASGYSIKSPPGAQARASAMAIHSMRLRLQLLNVVSLGPRRQLFNKVATRCTSPSVSDGDTLNATASAAAQRGPGQRRQLFNKVATRYTTRALPMAILSARRTRQTLNKFSTGARWRHTQRAILF